MHAAVYRITAPNPDGAAALARSLAVEAGDPLPRAIVRVALPAPGEATFRLLVEAEDIATLRAASNSFLKWLQAADGALVSLEGAGDA